MPEKKKILLVSDSHGQNHNLWSILEKEKPYDMVVHCGDYEYYESELVKRAGCETHIVAGNNDYGNDLPAKPCSSTGTGIISMRACATSTMRLCRRKRTSSFSGICTDLCRKHTAGLRS